MIMSTYLSAVQVLQDGGIFITEQVGGENGWDLVDMVLPGCAPDGINIYQLTHRLE